MPTIRDIHIDNFFEIVLLEDKIKFLLRYAVLAPSTHNSQPWLFKIENNSCKIYGDTVVYTIEEADPLGRDFYISLGCCIENLIIAAKFFNVYDKVVYRLGENKDLIAEVLFKDNADRENIDKNFEKNLYAILKRFNARGEFKKEKISDSVYQKLSGLNDFDDLKIDFVIDEGKIEKIAELTAAGLRIAYANPDFRKEMSGWINNNFSKKKKGIPGYSLRMPAFISFIFPALIRFFNIGKKLGWLNYKSLISAPLICLISSKENSPLLWLKTGRLAERLMLEFYSFNIKTSVFVAALEMGELYKEVQKVIGIDYVPQFLFAAGYMDFSPKKMTPRVSAESKIIF
ncbi:MAG: hypothetical protein HYW34_00045 [Candidatus Brennerbacteria bacterium]|nr:hypothetical protein [Candidatus Brennerbacteria bacterium]